MLDKSASKIDSTLKTLIAAGESQIKVLQAAVAAARQALTAIQVAQKAKSKDELKKVFPKVELAVGLLDKQIKVGWKINETVVSSGKAMDVAWKIAQTEYKTAR